MRMILISMHHSPSIWSIRMWDSMTRLCLWSLLIKTLMNMMMTTDRNDDMKIEKKKKKRNCPFMCDCIWSWTVGGFLILFRYRCNDDEKKANTMRRDQKKRAVLLFTFIRKSDVCCEWSMPVVIIMPWRQRWRCWWYVRFDANNNSPQSSASDMSNIFTCTEWASFAHKKISMCRRAGGCAHTWPPHTSTAHFRVRWLFIVAIVSVHMQVNNSVTSRFINVFKRGSAQKALLLPPDSLHLKAEKAECNQRKIKNGNNEKNELWAACAFRVFIATITMHRALALAHEHMDSFHMGK